MAGLTRGVHTRHELVISYKGRAKAVLGDEVFEILPGTAHWVRPGQFHSYFDFDTDTFLWLFFSFNLDQPSPLLPKKTTVSTLTPTDWLRLDEIGELYIRQPRDSTGIHAIAAKMAEFMGDLKQRPTDALIGRLNEKEAFSGLAMLKEIYLFVDDRMEKGIRIEDLARHLQLSEGHLRRVFRDLTGVSLGRWLQSSRLSRAVRLVAEGSLNISEIASLAGFETIHSFSQAFSKQTGMSPTTYRKHIAEGGEPFRLPGMGEQGKELSLSDTERAHEGALADKQEAK